MRGDKVKDSKRLTVDVPPDVHRALKVKTAERGTSIAEVVRTLVTEWIEQDQDEKKDSVKK
jgi:hypothetical protein